jgi:phospholipid transport system substrate-binding protein
MKRFLILVTMLLLATPARAEDGPGTLEVRKANEQLTALLRDKAPAKQVTQRVRGFLDIDELGKRAMRDHWAKLTPAQKKEFSSLLRALIEQSYVRGLKKNLEYDVAYSGESREGETIVVKTEIHAERRGRPFEIGIDYVLKQTGGTWKAYDVITDGVGLVENYRAQFNKIIAKEGFAGLVRLMKKKQDSDS